MYRIIALLNASFGLKWTIKQTCACLVGLVLIALLSFWGVSPDTEISPTKPGGSYLEIAFWITAIGASVLSYLILEILFRSRETRSETECVQP